MFFDFDKEFSGKENKVWVVSDTHYSHPNIVAGISKWDDIKNNCRPFNTLQEMNDTIISNINEKVKKTDTLIHLGDVAFGGKDKVDEFFDRINCNFIYVTSGNHDKHINHPRVKYFGDYIETRVNKTLVCMMHYPMYVWNEQHRGSVSLFGHVHAKVPGLGRSRDVGLDATNLMPLLLTDVVKELLSIPLVNNKRH